jgi:hypothetical protein
MTKCKQSLACQFFNTVIKYIHRLESARGTTNVVTLGFNPRILEIKMQKVP